MKLEPPARLYLILGLIAAVLIAAVVFGAVAAKRRPAPLWLVEAGYEEQWQRMLIKAPPGIELKNASAYDGKAGPGQFGYLITTKGPAPKIKADAGKITVYPALKSDGGYGGAFVLALDTWMIFRQYKEDGLDRSRAESAAAGGGLLIIPGLDPHARFAWLSQLLQERPGVFPNGTGAWQAAEDGLFAGGRFQRGAMTYNWNDAFDLFFDNPSSWIYAPLSRIRGLPAYRSGAFAAERFPEKPDWNNFGIQATILWAIPFGPEKEVAKLVKTKAWLKDGDTQTDIANTLKWAPASPQGKPYNAVSRSAWLAWLSSSFVWVEGD